MPLNYKKKTHKSDKDRNNHGSSSRHHRKSRKGSGSDAAATLDSHFTALTLSDDQQQPPVGICPAEPTALPYATATSPIFGRYLVAARDLPAGTAIIRQRPLVIGPCAEPVCLGCYVPLHVGTPAARAKQYKCPGCGWPMCGPSCAGLRQPLGHSTWECSALREKRVADKLERCKGAELEHAYEAIAPLRCLLLRQHCAASDSDDWAAVAGMESHDEVRRGCAALWQRNERVVVQRLRDSWGFGGEFSAADVHTVCGVLEVNCFEIGQNEGRARALYDVAYLLAHDCSANTSHSDAPGTYEMCVRVVRDVRAGEAITLSYAYTLQGTLKRRDHLQECKFFWCQCARCTDPTELGTFASAILCPKCTTASNSSSSSSSNSNSTGGLIVATDPLDQSAVWRCRACAYELSAASMLKLIDTVYAELDAIDANSVDGFEQFLRKYRNVFHRSHYLCVCAKHSLFQLYGRADGYLIQELSLEQLRTKEQHCRDLLAVVDRLDPGMSKLRGVIMYELHAPIMIQATRQFEAGQIYASDLKRRLLEVVQLLRDSERILRMEPAGTSEHEMSLAATDALQRIGHV